MSKPPLPSLTVLIPNYNHGHLIGDQLSTVLAQSVQPNRIIIIDDASTDDSVDFIRGFIAGHQHVQLVCRDANAGVVALSNQGLRMADTEYFTVLAADDMLKPGFIEKSLQLLARYPGAALCSTVTVVQSASSGWSIPNRASYPCTEPAYLPPEHVYKMLLRADTWIMSNTVIVRRDLLLAMGGQDARLMSWADEFIYRVLALKHGACFIPEALAINRRYDSGYSTTVWRDHESMKKILVTANAVIKEKFGGLFTPELLERTNSRLIFGMVTEKLQNFEAGAEEITRALPPVRGASLFLFGVRWARKTLNIVFFAVLRYRDIPGVLLSRLRGR